MWRFRLLLALHRLGVEKVRVCWTSPVTLTPGGGFTAELVIETGTTHEATAALAARLAVALGVDEVSIVKSGPTRALLSARQPLPEALPAYPARRPACIVPPRTPDRVPLGIDADGFPVELPLYDGAGGLVTLIAGSPGAGKSSALRLILAGLVQSHTAVIWLDPKGGADAAAYASRAEVHGDAIGAVPALTVLRRLNALVSRRMALLASGRTTLNLQRVVVIIDEWAALGVDGDRKERDLVADELRRLAATGRAAGVSLVLATQRPTAATIDVATRGLAGVRLCFAVGDPHASIAALGVPGAEQLSATLDRGTALLDVGAGARKVRLYEVPAGLDAETRLVAGLRTDLDYLAAMER